MKTNKRTYTKESNTVGCLRGLEMQRNTILNKLTYKQQVVIVNCEGLMKV